MVKVGQIYKRVSQGNMDVEGYIQIKDVKVVVTSVRANIVSFKAKDGRYLYSTHNSEDYFLEVFNLSTPIYLGGE